MEALLPVSYRPVWRHGDGFSLSQETGERTTLDRDELGTEYIEDLRSPEIRNTVLDAKASKPFNWHGQHQSTFGAQFIRTTLHDQNPGAHAQLPEDQRYDEKFAVDQWALYAEDEWRLNASSHCRF